MTDTVEIVRHLQGRFDKITELARDAIQTDGAHHKDWYLNEILREVLRSDYDAFVAKAKAGADGPDTYDWNEGIAP